MNFVSTIFYIVAMIWMLGNLACVGLGAWLLWMIIQDKQYNRKQRSNR